MSSILSSQGVVIATAMVISSTALFLAFSKHDKIFLHADHHKTLRSCLSSGDRKGERKKKKVRFAEDVKEPNGNGEKYRREHDKKVLGRTKSNTCRNEIPRIQVPGIPQNRVALYNGILKERLHRMECSF